MVLKQKVNTSTIDLGLKVMVEDMIMVSHFKIGDKNFRN